MRQTDFQVGIPVSKNRQFAVLACGKILALLCTFAMPFCLTRLLQKSEYGVYSQLFVITSFITATFSFGVPNSLYYFYPRAKGNEHRTVLGNTLGVLLFLSVVSVFLLCIPVIGNLLIGNGELSRHLPVVCLCVFFLMPALIIDALYVVNGDCKTSFIYPSASIVVKAVFVLGLVWWLGGLTGVFSGLIVTDCALFLFVLWYVWRENRGYGSAPFFSRSLLKRQLNYAIPGGLAIIFESLALRLDKIICVSVLTASEYATYAVAFFGIPGIQQVYGSMADVYVANISMAFARYAPREALSLFHELAMKNLSLLFPSVLIASLFANEIIVFIFTPAYLSSVPYFRIYIFSMPIIMSGISLVIRGSGKMQYSLYSYAIAAVFSIPATWILIRRHGAMGGVIAAAIAQTLPRMIQALFEAKILRIPWYQYYPWKDAAKIVALSLVILIPFYLLHRVVQFNIFISGLFALFYLGLVTFAEMRFKVAMITWQQFSGFISKNFNRLFYYVS